MAQLSSPLKIADQCFWVHVDELEMPCHYSLGFFVRCAVIQFRSFSWKFATWSLMRAIKGLTMMTSKVGIVRLRKKIKHGAAQHSKETFRRLSKDSQRRLCHWWTLILSDTLVLQESVYQLHSYSGYWFAHFFDSDLLAYVLASHSRLQVTNCAIISKLAIWLALPTFRQR